jgi:hypothetical protein
VRERERRAPTRTPGEQEPTADGDRRFFEYERKGTEAKHGAYPYYEGVKEFIISDLPLLVRELTVCKANCTY